MKRTKILALLLTAVVIIIAAIFLLPQGAGKSSKKTVVVANQTIPAYAEITEEMLTTAEYSDDDVPENAVMEIENAVGCKTLVEISTKEMLMSNHLIAGEDVSGGLSLLLDDGMRAMSVLVDEVTGVSNLLKVGNKVDVIAVLPNVNNDMVSKMLLENIEIVALDTTLMGNPVDADGAPYYTTVTLAVKPQDAVKLALCSSQGTVYLMERPQNDAVSVPTTQIKVENIAE